MTADFIKKAVLWSVRCGFASMLIMPIIYFGVSFDFTSTLLNTMLAVLSMLLLSISAILFIFGFLTPILGNYIYQNILDNSMKNTLLKSKFWRFFIKISDETHDRKDELK